MAKASKKKMACARCNGEFSSKMSVEYIDGKEHHSYCAGEVRKERAAEEKPIPWLIRMLVPWIPAR